MQNTCTCMIAYPHAHTHSLLMLHHQHMPINKDRCANGYDASIIFNVLQKLMDIKFIGFHETKFSFFFDIVAKSHTQPKKDLKGMLKLVMCVGMFCVSCSDLILTSGTSNMLIFR